MSLGPIGGSGFASDEVFDKKERVESMGTAKTKKTICVYPGSFCPSTYGHVKIVEDAAALFEKVYVICSVNPEKERSWFTPDECKALWQGYKLPANVEVLTLVEFIGLGVDPKRIVMIRGLRGECDAEDEKKVMMLNWKKYGIEKFFFIITDERFTNVSSSAAREAAEACDLQRLPELVSPAVVTKLLEKVLAANNLFIVVGPPGSGKSTILKRLAADLSDNAWICTDDFNQALKDFLRERFPEQDVIDAARANEAEVKELLKDRWLAMLGAALIKVKGKHNVFVEIAYGLREDYRLYRFMGAKVIYIGCEDRTELERRNHGRGTPRICAFIDRIPFREESCRIAEREGLHLWCVDTSRSVEAVDDEVREIERVVGSAG